MAKAEGIGQPRLRRPGGLPGGKFWAPVVGGLMAAVVATGAVAAQSCIRSEEKLSIEVRALQTELMVAALSCNASHEYNNFVLRFRPVLTRHGKTLTQYFDRLYGSAAEREVTRYVTGLANRSSLQSVADLNKFCDTTLDTLRTVNGVAPADFDAFAFTRQSSLGPDLGPESRAMPCSLARNG